LCNSLAACRPDVFDDKVKELRTLREKVAEMREEQGKLLEQAVPATKKNVEKMNAIKYEDLKK